MDRIWVSYAPHIKAKQTTNNNYYLLILIACSIAVSMFKFYGYMILVSCASSALACFLCDLIFKRIRFKKWKIDELSSIYVGLLVALSMPSGALWYIPIIVSVFVTIFIKNACGGVGNNFVSEVAVAKILAYLIFGSLFYRFIDINSGNIITQSSIDCIINNIEIEGINSKNAFFSIFNAGVGESFALVAIICGFFLALLKLIDYKLSLLYLVFSFCFSILFFGFNSSVLLLFGSGIVFVAVFVLTDFGSAPKSITMVFVVSLIDALVTVLIWKYGNFALARYYAVCVGGLVNATVEGVVNGRCSKER